MFAPEGYPFMAFFAALAVAAALLLGGWPVLIPLLGLGFMMFFFRDPERTPPEEPGYLAPADGKVIRAERVRAPEPLQGPEALLISIFMSPLDVHVNRSPCAGVVQEVRRIPGGHHSAFTEEAFRGNECVLMLLGCSGAQVLLRQVAGSVARRAVCRARPGEVLARGQRFGIIKFSSRVDVFLPPEAQALVQVGQRVLAGRSLIAR
jgi:phosphatidylserine decarboxylase